MISIEELKSKQEKICIVGLGYVGLPLALLLAKYFDVVGFDINQSRVEELKQGKDRTGEVTCEQLNSVSINYSSDPSVISQARFIIVALPTPIDKNNIPDLTILKRGTQMVGQQLKEGSVVVYESTVYPGVTEEICGKILEEESGMRYGVGFKVGYSPERVNPGDKEHTIDKVVKVVSGMDEESALLISQVYGTLTTVFCAKSIQVAEAEKIIENVQRDLNIALMNELAILFFKMGISIYDVIEAASTKWNFMPFKPGLVGGHCIGVDPYYLTYKAQAVGHNPKIILAGRSVNDNMHKFIAHRIIKKMIQMGKDVSGANFVVLGITFKENVPDVRNSKVAALCMELKDFGIKPMIYDPHADPEEVKKEYGIDLCSKHALPKADTLIVAVAHDELKKMSIEEIRSMMNDENLLLVDIKSLYSKEEVEGLGMSYLTL